MATFGQATSLTTDQAISDIIAGSPATCPGNGTVNSLSFYVDYRDPSTFPCKCAIYNPSNSALIATTAEINVTSTGWKTANISGTPLVTANTSYVLVAWSKTVAPKDFCGISRDNTTVNALRRQSLAYTTNFPATANFVTATGIACVYCTYTPAAGGSANAPTAHFGPGLNRLDYRG